MKPIRKAIFPVAGLGTRFLPATKAMPKEMLPVVDRPLIQHVVDEARQAGIEHFIFVTGRNKSVIEDHFDRQFELEMTLRERQKRADLQLLSQDLPAPGTTSFTRQQEPLGLGHAVWCARELVGREPFALLLPDLLAAQQRGTGSELQLDDAMIGLSAKQPFYGLKFDGRSFDCGSKVGFLAANIAYPLERPDMAPAMRVELKRLLGES